MYSILRKNRELTALKKKRTQNTEVEFDLLKRCREKITRGNFLRKMVLSTAKKMGKSERINIVSLMALT